MTPAARRYLESERAWQRQLRRRRARLVVGLPQSGRDQLDLAKAKRARLKQRAAYVTGQDGHPMGRYDAEAVERLGREGKALARGDGSHWFPIVDLRDLHNAIAAYLALKASERNGVRAWIVKRARELGLDEQLPKGWGALNPGLHPNELERER
jgi:hypothetical protein